MRSDARTFLSERLFGDLNNDFLARLQQFGDGGHDPFGPFSGMLLDASRVRARFWLVIRGLARPRYRLPRRQILRRPAAPDQSDFRRVPASSVRFMHEARNDREKGELFAAARAGRISVLIGSTEKMGVGTNVQARAIAAAPPRLPLAPGRPRPT